jgi:hypothetical protein
VSPRVPVSGNKPKPKPKPVNRGAKRRTAVVAFSHTLVGIREMPPGSHSNDGPAVRIIQRATGAYRAPWCVSTVQHEDLHVLGSTYANRTAGVYQYLEYAQHHGHTVPRPLPGDVVAYLIGNGHMGRVIHVYANGSFDAIEGNHSDACAIVHRDPRYLTCRFIRRPEYR